MRYEIANIKKDIECEKNYRTIINAVDVTVINAVQIWRLPLSLNCKTKENIEMALIKCPDCGK